MPFLSAGYPAGCPVWQICESSAEPQLQKTRMPCRCGATRRTGSLTATEAGRPVSRKGKATGRPPRSIAQFDRDGQRLQGCRPSPNISPERMGPPIRSICSQHITQSAKENPTDCKPLQLEFQAFGSRKVVGDGGRLSTDGGALLLRQADALLDLTPRLAATTGARGGSSIRCGSWSPSGCSVFCRVTRTSTTMTSSGPTACWRWLSGDLTGEERGRDRGIPLAGHREPVWACPARPRRTGTRRSSRERWTISSLSLDACPSPRDLPGCRLHRRPGARQPGGASLPRLLLLLPSALPGRPDFVFAVAACERRPGGGHGGGTGAGAHSQALAEDRRSRRQRLLPRRSHDVVRRQRGRLSVRLVPQRPPDGAQAIAQVAQPLRLDRRGVAAVLRLPLPDPNVVEPDVAGGGAAGSSRRPFRRDFPGLQAGGGAGPLRETVLRSRGELRSSNSTCSPTGPRPRPCGRTSCASTSRRSPATAAIRRVGLDGTGEDRAQAGSDETSQGRRLHFGSEGSALVFFGLALEGSVRPGPGEPAGAADPNLTPFAASTAL